MHSQPIVREMDVFNDQELVCHEKMEVRPARASFHFDPRSQLAASGLFEAKNEDSFCSISTFKDPFEAASERKSGNSQAVGRPIQQPINLETHLTHASPSYWQKRSQRGSFELDRLRGLDDELMQQEHEKMRFQLLGSSASGDA
jgi:hypothetical protein